MRARAGLDDPVERFRVRPGAVTALRVCGGDRVDVIDPHGRQPAELTVLSTDPAAVPGTAPDAPASDDSPESSE